MNAPGVGRSKPTDERLTPGDLWRELDREFKFELDVACQSSNCLAPIGIYRDKGHDGLHQNWAEQVPVDRAIWCNPPYSLLLPWMRKCAIEGATRQVVALVPVDVSTRWWRFVAERATEVRFVNERLVFGNHGCAERSHFRYSSAVVVFTPAGGPPRHSYIDAKGKPAIAREFATSGDSAR